MKRSRKFQCIIFATTMAIGASAWSAAPSQLDQQLTVTVSYRDLNVHSDEGARELYSRLQRASRKACDTRNRRVVGSLRELAKARQCYNETLSAAVETVDSDALTRLHNI